MKGWAMVDEPIDETRREFLGTSALALGGAVAAGSAALAIPVSASAQSATVKGSTVIGQGQAPAASAVGNPQQSRAQQLMGDIAPKLAELTDSVLYGDIWERPQLSKRDRSLITVSALIAMNRPDQLRSHLALAGQNGVTEDELIEAITHLAFYAGWPSAVSAVSVTKEVFQTK
jgi:4-carboxymuconolactone decarboxylase